MQSVPMNRVTETKKKTATHFFHLILSPGSPCFVIVLRD